MSQGKAIVAVLVWALSCGCSKDEPASKQASVTAMDQGLEVARGGDDATEAAYLDRIQAGEEVEALAMERDDAEARAKAEAIDTARSAGLLGTIQTSGQKPGDSFDSADDKDVYGGLLGDDLNDTLDGFGFDSSGSGPSAGGKGSVTSSDQESARVRHGNPQVRIGTVTATGDLDKNIIRRYIRRKLPRIKYCYEKQLLVHAGLEGTVTVSFEISPSGQVSTASASGVNDEVSMCMAEVIKAIQFPEPKDGGVVRVLYPFMFQPR